MRTSASNSGRGLKISLAICLPSNNQSWRDEVASPRPKHNRGGLYCCLKCLRNASQPLFVLVLVLEMDHVKFIQDPRYVLFGKLFRRPGKHRNHSALIPFFTQGITHFMAQVRSME